MLNTNEFEHSVGASLDYGHNWSAKGWLTEGETITSSVWTVPTGITKSAEQIVGGITSAIFTGGESGVIYKIINTITTSAGRTDSRTIILSCKQR